MLDHQFFGWNIVISDRKGSVSLYFRSDSTLTPKQPLNKYRNSVHCITTDKRLQL